MMTSTEITAISAAVALGLLQAYTAWKQSKTSKTVEVIHKLTNSNMGEQLKIGMISAMTLANQTKLPEHKALADVAEEKFRLHEEDQAKVDAGTKSE